MRRIIADIDTDGNGEIDWEEMHIFKLGQKACTNMESTVEIQTLNAWSLYLLIWVVMGIDLDKYTIHIWCMVYLPTFTVKIGYM